MLLDRTPNTTNNPGCQIKNTGLLWIVKASETTVASGIGKVESKVDAIDTRLRTVETGVAEIRGRSIGVGVLRDWIVTLCAVGAFIISIFALLKAQQRAPQTTQDTQKAVSQ